MMAIAENVKYLNYILTQAHRMIITTAIYVLW